MTLQQAIERYNKIYPTHRRHTFHLIESIGEYEDLLFLWFIRNNPTAYVYKIKLTNQIFIAI